MAEETTERERESPASELMGQRSPTPGAREAETAAFVPKCIKDKKYTLVTAAVITVLIIIIIALAAQKPQSCSPCPPPVDASCPDRWVGYQGKCYYTSESESSWNLSGTICFSFNASLAVIDTLLDLSFLKNLTRPHHFWIGLSREEAKAWRWPNGTEFNNQFPVRGAGQCAYIDDIGVSSTLCSIEKNFLCSQPDACARKRKPTRTKKDTSSASTPTFE